MAQPAMWHTASKGTTSNVSQPAMAQPAMAKAKACNGTAYNVALQCGTACNLALQCGTAMVLPVVKTKLEIAEVMLEHGAWAWCNGTACNGTECTVAQPAINDRVYNSFMTKE